LDVNSIPRAPSRHHGLHHALEIRDATGFCGLLEAVGLAHHGQIVIGTTQEGNASRKAGRGVAGRDHDARQRAEEGVEVRRTLVIDPWRVGPLADLNRYPVLGKPELELSGVKAHAGRVAGEPFISAIGGLLPMALCGWNALESLCQASIFERASALARIAFEEIGN